MKISRQKLHAYEAVYAAVPKIKAKYLSILPKGKALNLLALLGKYE